MTTIPTLWHFDDVLAEMEKDGGKRHLLIGAGFSAGASEAMTSYGLAKMMRAVSGYDEVERLFQLAGSQDVEQVMAYVLHRARVSGTDAADRWARVAVQRLQNFFGNSVARSQFEGVDGNVRERMGHAACFLAPFSSVFSLNYDLTPYRARLRAEEDGLCKFTDGFGPATDSELQAMVYEGFYSRSTRNRFYWPHGALFITRDEIGRLLKLTQQSTAFLSGVDREFLQELGKPTLTDICLFGYDRISPLFVAGGNDQQKRAQIAADQYLREALSAFGALEGHLVTYGWSMSDADDHLVDAIAVNPNLRNLYVGIYGDPCTTDNQCIIAKAQTLLFRRDPSFEPLNVQFYSSDSASVWGEPDAQFTQSESSDWPFK